MLGFSKIVRSEECGNNEGEGKREKRKEEKKSTDKNGNPTVANWMVDHTRPNSFLLLSLPQN